MQWPPLLSSAKMEESKQQTFVDVIKNNKIVLNKSQIPTIRAAKESAMLLIQTQYKEATGVEMSVSQIKKRVQNIKTELKKKSDMKATGNRPIVLKNWEREFLDLMDHQNNPVFVKVPGAIEIVGDEIQVENYSQDENEGDQMNNSKSANETKEIKPKKLKIDDALPNETDETRKLSLPQLQRLVLLEQLTLIRTQQKVQEKKMQNTQNEILNEIFDV